MNKSIFTTQSSLSVEAVKKFALQVQGMEISSATRVVDFEICSIFECLRSTKVTQLCKEELLTLVIQLFSKHHLLFQKAIPTILDSAVILLSTQYCEDIALLYVKLLSLLGCRFGPIIPVNLVLLGLQGGDVPNKLLLEFLCLVPYVGGEAKQVAEIIIPFLRHRNSKIRISAISTIDLLIRKSPTSFEIVSLLNGFSEGIVSVDEFYSDSARTNYMAVLTFDPHLEVRRTWFTVLFDWSVSLTDREDVERWICPYILTSLLDQQLEEEMTTLFEARIGPLYDGCCCQFYIKKNARHFLPCFFTNLTSSAVEARMIQLVIVKLEQHIVEFLPGLMSWLTRRGIVEYPSITETICSSIARHVDCDIWWNALNFSPPYAWDVLSFLLRNTEEDVVNPQLQDLVLDKLMELGVISCGGVRTNFQEIWKKVQRRNCRKSFFCGVILFQCHFNCSHYENDIVTDTSKELIALHDAEIARHLLLLPLPVPSKQVIATMIVAECATMRLAPDLELLKELSRICDINDLLSTLFTLESTDQDLLLNVVELCTNTCGINLSLINLVLDRAKWSSHLVACFCRIHASLPTDEMFLKKVFKRIVEEATSCPHLIVELVSLLHKSFAHHLQLEQVLDLLLPWAIEADEDHTEIHALIKSFVDEVGEEPFKRIITQYESTGFISRYVYLNKLIL